MRVIKKPPPVSKRRKKRQFEAADFLTQWSEAFNIANLGENLYVTGLAGNSESGFNGSVP